MKNNTNLTLYIGKHKILHQPKDIDNIKEQINQNTVSSINNSLFAKLKPIIEEYIDKNENDSVSSISI